MRKYHPRDVVGHSFEALVAYSVQKPWRQLRPEKVEQKDGVLDLRPRTYRGFDPVAPSARFYEFVAAFRFAVEKNLLVPRLDLEHLGIESYFAIESGVDRQ